MSSVVIHYYDLVLNGEEHEQITNPRLLGPGWTHQAVCPERKNWNTGRGVPPTASAIRTAVGYFLRESGSPEWGSDIYCFRDLGQKNHSAIKGQVTDIMF